MSRRKPPPLEPVSRFIISSQPMCQPPQGNGVECTEAVHWYWTPKGWTDKKSKAHIFETSSSALAKMAALRRATTGVEFALVPIVGDLFYKPAW